MSLEAKQKTQGWEAADDKPSHDLFDSHPPGGTDQRRAVFRFCQPAAQWLWRFW
jgi:hypothetical protein